MKRNKDKKSKKNIEVCKYPKCNKEVHEVGFKYCGNHQRKIANNKSVFYKSVVGTVVTVASVAIVPILKKLKIK